MAPLPPPKSAYVSVRLSVCLSVCDARAFNSKTKGAEKPDLV